MPLTSTRASNTAHALGEFYSFSLDYLVIGSGGGGGGSNSGRFGGGGGAGDLLQTATFATGGVTSPKLSGITPGTVLYILQGIPGTGGSSDTIGGNGNPSSISFLSNLSQKFVYASGGGGGGLGGTSGTSGAYGASGGGGGKSNGTGGSAYLSTNGNAGGTAQSGTGAGAGGGGAGGAGNSVGTGGAGLANTITGTSVTYCIGGSAGSTSGPSTYGCGGYAGNANANGANGNYGVVIISWLASAYKGTPKFNGTVPPTVQTNGIYKYVVFDFNITNSTTITF